MGGMIKCLGCGEILHSLYRYDFKQCKCKQGSFVDGGFSYIRIGGKELNKVILLVHKHLENEVVI